jgi:VWFA-related protein
MGTARPVLVACLVCSVAVASGSAQRASAPAVELAPFEFQALGAEGPVDDLKVADLALKVDGRAREIRSLEFISHSKGADPVAAGLSDRGAPPFGTNIVTGPAGRTILLIVNNDSLRPGTDREVAAAVVRFTRMLAPTDRVAFVTVPLGGLLVDLTTDHARVAEAAQKLTGLASTTGVSADRACRTRDTLNALANTLGGIAGSSGAKTVIFLSSGMVRPTRDAPLLGPPGMCELKNEHFEEVGRAANEARAQLYVIRPEELIIDPAATSIGDPGASRFRNTDEELAGLESVAGVGNGTFMHLQRGDDTPFRRVLKETSGHYVLRFEPTRGERNGQLHRIELRSTRGDVRIVARSRVPIARTAQRSSATPQAMLRDARAYPDLPIRVSGYVSRNPGDSKLRILGLLETVEPDTALQAAAFGLIDQRDKLVAQWTVDDTTRTDGYVMAAGLAAPGAYRLRAAAIDADGRRGMAEYPLDATLEDAGPLALSALVLGVSRNGSFAARLQFANEPTAMGYFEIYGARPAGTLSVAFELAPTAQSPSTVRIPGTITPTSDGDRQTATGVVPLGAVGPGDYIVRAIVSLDGRPLGRLERPLRKAGS